MIRSYKTFNENESKKSRPLSTALLGSWMQEYDFEHYYDGLSEMFQNFKNKIKYVMSESREILGVEEAKVMRDRNGGLTRVNIIFDENSAKSIAEDVKMNNLYGNMLRRLVKELEPEGIDVSDNFGSICLYILDRKIKSLE